MARCGALIVLQAGESLPLRIRIDLVRDAVIVHIGHASSIVRMVAPRIAHASLGTPTIGTPETVLVSILHAHAIDTCLDTPLLDTCMPKTVVEDADDVRVTARASARRTNSTILACIVLSLLTEKVVTHERDEHVVLAQVRAVVVVRTVEDPARATDRFALFAFAVLGRAGLGRGTRHASLLLADEIGVRALPVTPLARAADACVPDMQCPFTFVVTRAVPVVQARAAGASTAEEHFRRTIPRSCINAGTVHAILELGGVSVT